MHPPSLIRVFACARWVAKDASFLYADSEDSDQIARMFGTVRFSGGAGITSQRILPSLISWAEKPFSIAFDNNVLTFKSDIHVVDLAKFSTISYPSFPKLENKIK